MPEKDGCEKNFFNVGVMYFQKNVPWTVDRNFNFFKIQALVMYVFTPQSNYVQDVPKMEFEFSNITIFKFSIHLNIVNQN